jgi:hypothetical protein
MQEPTTAIAVRAPMDLTANIEELQKKNYNILLPVTRFASQNELFVPRLDIVVPDINAGDFYKQGSKKVGNAWVDILAPSGAFLNKIASAANIQWHPDKCGHTVVEKNRVVYKAVAALRQADGQWRTITDEYELDLEVVEEELRMDYKKKAKTQTFQEKMKKESMELEDYIMRDLLQKRRHKLALAASGAMNRVIRKALTLRSTYLADEAKNPFAIARFDFQPDYNDPTVRRYASIAAIQAQNDLYGQGSAAMPEDVSQDEIQLAGEMMGAGSIANIDGQIIDMETGEVNPPGLEIIDVTLEPEPESEPPVMIGCEGEECGGILEPFKDADENEWQPEAWAEKTKQMTGRKLCVACFIKWQKEQKAIKEAEKAAKQKDKAGGK